MNFSFMHSTWNVELYAITKYKVSIVPVTKYYPEITGSIQFSSWFRCMPLPWRTGLRRAATTSNTSVAQALPR